MLVRLIYASRPTESLRPETLAAILKKSVLNNHATGVTGVLCSTGDAFLQALEGGRPQVNRLYNRIAADPRHEEVTLLSYEDITERCFASWAMGKVDMARLNRALVLKYSDTSRLDPFMVSGQVSLALLNELASTASLSMP